ncbi:MAG: tetratricopeptide repeat protein, partial [Myxococcales bacterium]|nr:tetratricopeptide repeat protein [Myxococcales bacterium]
MRRLGLALATGVLVAGAALGGAASAEEERGVRRFESQVANLEDAIGRLVREFANPLAIVRKFPHQTRLIDARVFYDLGNYENAAIVLMDVLDDPAFRGDLEYESAELLLGQALLKIDNPKAARDQFSAVAKGRDAKLAEEARYYLIEMALSDGDTARLKELVAQFGGTASSDRTRFGLGKAYLQLNDPDKAILWLKVVSPQSEFFTRARYYLGAAYTAKKQYTDALSIFSGLTGGTADDAEAQALKDLSWLAVGRLQSETGDLTTALTSYQNIGRNSPHYEVALYEMAWTYIKLEQYDRALLTVDVLLLTVQDEQINVDAHVLRGRLNVMMNDYDEAMDSYSAIIDRFAPIRNELVRFTRDPADIQRYFQWLLERQKGQAALKAPLSERTSKWVESTDDIGRVASVFDRISGESSDIAEATGIGHDLEKILSSRNRVELFPNLRDGWTRALALQNRLVLVSSQVLDAEAALIEGKLPREDATEIAELIAYRRSLDEKVRTLPQTFEAYDRRQAAMNQRFADLARKQFMVEQNLAEVQRQLLAIERYLDDKQFSDTSTDKLPAAREAGIRADIEAEKKALTGLFGELKALKRTIELEARSVGTGDEASAGERGLRTALLDAHRREQDFYSRVGLRIGRGVDQELASYAALRGRVVAAIARLDGVIAAIDEEVASKTAELRTIVSRELGSLAGYQGEVAIYDGEGRDLARDMGEELFRRAQGRMNEVVLEADVG